MKKSEQVPKQLQPIYDAITVITDGFCNEHLNAEYAQLSRQLAAALSRKRPSPLLRGTALLLTRATRRRRSRPRRIARA